MAAIISEKRASREQILGIEADYIMPRLAQATLLGLLSALHTGQVVDA